MADKSMGITHATVTKKRLFLVFNVGFFLLFGLLWISLCLFNNSTVLFRTSYQMIAGVLVLGCFLFGAWLLIHWYDRSALWTHHFNWIYLAGMALLFALQVIYVLEIRTFIGWDCGVLTSTAYRPDMHSAGDYFSTYPNNLFLLFVFRTVTWVCTQLHWGMTEYYTILILINVIAVDVAISCIIWAAKRLFGTRKAYLTWMVCIALLGFMPWLIVPYSDTLSMPFPAAILFFYVCLKQSGQKTHKVLCGIAMGLCTAIGYLVKPTVVIVLIAIGCVELATGLRRGMFAGTRLTDWCRAAVPAVCVGLSILLTLSAFQCFLDRQTAIEIQEEKGVPMTHFLMMGMQTKYDKDGRPLYGVWNEDDVALTLKQSDTAQMKQANLAEIKRRLADFGVGGYLRFLFDKARWITSEGTFFWGGEGNFADYTLTREDDGLKEYVYPPGEHYGVYKYYAQGVWIAALFLVVSVAFWRKKENWQDPWRVLLRLTFLGVVLFILLFEGRSRYLILYLPFVALLAADGLDVLHGRLRRLLLRWKRGGQVKESAS